LLLEKVAAMSRISCLLITLATIATALAGTVYLAEAQGSAKAKSSPSGAPNLAVNPAKKKVMAKTAEACGKSILTRSRRALATSGEHSRAGV
jgi:hypothetical protein